MIKTKNAEDYENLLMDRVNQEKNKLYSQIQAKNFKIQKKQRALWNGKLESQSLQQLGGGLVDQYNFES